jgi:hypothetical protein
MSAFHFFFLSSIFSLPDYQFIISQPALHVITFTQAKLGHVLLRQAQKKTTLAR